MGQLIADPDNVVLVSAATAWEIVTMRHAERAGSLPGPHKDPFDPMLIAQALEEACTLISNEAVFDRYAVSRSW
jgi:PIN domain nuclease of toxin-antitoxin system